MQTLATHSSLQQQPFETVLFFLPFLLELDKKHLFFLFAPLTFSWVWGLWTHRDLNCPPAHQSINPSPILSIPAQHHGRSFNLHSSFIFIHPSIRPLVHSRHFLVLCLVVCVATSSVLLGVARACGGRSCHPAILFRQEREATHWRSLTYTTTSRLASLGDYQPTGSAHIDLPPIDSWYRHRRKQTWTNFQLPPFFDSARDSRPPSLGS